MDWTIYSEHIFWVLFRIPYSKKRAQINFWPIEFRKCVRCMTEVNPQSTMHLANLLLVYM
jgi:hypothetical protein